MFNIPVRAGIMMALVMAQAIFSKISIVQEHSSVKSLFKRDYCTGISF
jgi:hypothetical protein